MRTNDLTHTLTLSLAGRGDRSAGYTPANMLNTRQHQVRGVHVESVALVYVGDELLNQLVVQRKRAPTLRALQMMMIRLADPLEHGVAGAHA